MLRGGATPAGDRATAPDASSGNVKGSVAGYSPTVVQQAASYSGSATIVYLTSFDEGCALASVWYHANSTTIELYANGTAPGTYPFLYAVDAGGPHLGQAYFHVWGPTCGSDILDSLGDGSIENLAYSGEITLTEVSAAKAVGSFDLTFPDGRLTGTFDAPICPPPDGGGQVCQ